VQFSDGRRVTYRDPMALWHLLQEIESISATGVMTTLARHRRG
jgi:hypothetical protein